MNNLKCCLLIALFMSFELKQTLNFPFGFLTATKALTHLVDSIKSLITSTVIIWTSPTSNLSWRSFGNHLSGVTTGLTLSFVYFWCILSREQISGKNLYNSGKVKIFALCNSHYRRSIKFDLMLESSHSIDAASLLETINLKARFLTQ